MVGLVFGSMKQYGGFGYYGVVEKDNVPQVIVFAWTINRVVRKTQREMKRLL